MSNIQHPLQNTWVFWMQDLSDDPNSWKVHEICEFSSVEEFWRMYSVFPKPSNLFYDGYARKSLAGKEIESLAVFKKNIYPGWEDEINAKGSELVYRKVNLNIDLLDIYWECIVLSLIGESIDLDEDIICGCRVVDKSKIKSGTKIYKLDIWLSTGNQGKGEEYNKRLVEIVNNEGLGDNVSKRKSLPSVDFEWKRHNL